MRSCLFLFLDLLPKKKRKESPTDWSYHFLVPGLIKQEWTLLSRESDVYILITDLPKCTELSGQQVGCSEVPGKNCLLNLWFIGCVTSVTQFKFLSCELAGPFLCDGCSWVGSSCFLLNAYAHVCYISMTMCSHQYNYDCISTCPVKHIIQGFMRR